MKHQLQPESAASLSMANLEAVNLCLHSPDTSVGTRPNKVAGYCVLSLRVWGQHGLIRVYDFKISSSAAGFIMWLHGKRIIWDSLIKQLSEQKGKKVGLREIILFVDSNLHWWRKHLWLMKFSRVSKSDREAATPWTRRGSHSVGFQSNMSVENVNNWWYFLSGSLFFSFVAERRLDLVRSTTLIRASKLRYKVREPIKMHLTNTSAVRNAHVLAD